MSEYEGVRRCHQGNRPLGIVAEEDADRHVWRFEERAISDRRSGSILGFGLLVSLLIVCTS